MQAVFLTLQVFDDDVVNVAQARAVFEHLPGRVRMEVDLDEILVANGQQAVARDQHGGMHAPQADERSAAGENHVERIAGLLSGGRLGAYPLCWGAWVLAVDAADDPQTAATTAPTTLLGRPSSTLSPEQTPALFPQEKAAAAN